MSDQLTAVATIQEALPQLRRPFTEAAVKWKIQANPKEGKDKALLVAYIDARLVAERLNAVCPALWSDAYKPVDGGLMCAITLEEDSGRKIMRSDVGWSEGTGNGMDLKALYSDAFKRASVKWGIGVSIYALPQQWLSVDKGEIKKFQTRRGDGFSITQKGLDELRKRYKDWLKSHGEGTFGTPGDHGDVLDAQGDAETGERGAAVEESGDDKPAAKPAAKKTEAKTDAAPRIVSAAGIDAIKAELLLSTKGGVDVTNWLTAKDVVDASGTPGDLDACLPTLLADQAKELHAWLKANRAKGATNQAA